MSDGQEPPEAAQTARPAYMAEPEDTAQPHEPLADGQHHAVDPHAKSLGIEPQASEWIKDHSDPFPTEEERSQPAQWEAHAHAEDRPASMAHDRPASPLPAETDFDQASETEAHRWEKQADRDPQQWQEAGLPQQSQEDSHISVDAGSPEIDDQEHANEHAGADQASDRHSSSPAHAQRPRSADQAAESPIMAEDWFADPDTAMEQDQDEKSSWRHEYEAGESPEDDSHYAGDYNDDADDGDFADDHAGDQEGEENLDVDMQSEADWQQDDGDGGAEAEPKRAKKEATEAEATSPGLDAADQDNDEEHRGRPHGEEEDNIGEGDGGQAGLNNEDGDEEGDKGAAMDQDAVSGQLGEPENVLRSLSPSSPSTPSTPPSPARDVHADKDTHEVEPAASPADKAASPRRSPSARSHPSEEGDQDLATSPAGTTAATAAAPDRPHDPLLPYLDATAIAESLPDLVRCARIFSF